MRSLTLSLTLALALVGSACAKTPPSLTPVGVKYFQANRGIVAIGTVQHVAIELNKVQICTPEPCHPLLSEANTRIVVDATTDTITTITATPEGWKPTLDTGLKRIEDRLDAAGKTELAAYLAAARAILTSF